MATWTCETVARAEGQPPDAFAICYWRGCNRSHSCKLETVRKVLELNCDPTVCQ
jgi:hypothetical protein